MRYRNLLVALFIVGTMTIIWAKPSEEVVVVPTTVELVALTQDDDNPSPLDGWSYDISSDSETQQPSPQPRPKSHFGLELSVTTGSDIESTIFEVQVKTPPESQLTTYNFSVAFNKDSNQVYYAHDTKALGEGRFRFSGANLISVDGSGDTAAGHLRLEVPTQCVVSARVAHPSQGRFSRGARHLILRSQPVRVGLR